MYHTHDYAVLDRCKLQAYLDNQGEFYKDSWPDFDLLFMAKKSGMRMLEVPVHYKSRKAGKSKMKTFSHAYGLFKMLLKSLLGTY